MTDYSKFKIADAFKHIDPQHSLVDDIPAGFSSIRYRGKTWMLNHAGKIYPFRRDDDNTPLSYIDMITLGISEGISRVYFGGEWTEDSNNAPICTSRRGDVPDPGVPVQQSPSCGTCKQAEWVPQPNGKSKPACQQHKNVAILLMPAMTKKMFNGTPLIEPIHLKIPPGSLRSFKAYYDDLRYQNIPFESVVTRVGFSPDRQFEMSFELTQALSNAEAKVVLPLTNNPMTRQILGSAPTIRVIESPKPMPRQDSGLLQAFGVNGAAAAEAHIDPVQAPLKQRGRPKSVKTEEQVAAPTPSAPSAVTAKPAPAATPVQEEGDWENSNDELDESVTKLLGDKMGNMMK